MSAVGAPRFTVRVDDPSTIGRRRFPRERAFETLRETERYAARAIALGIGAEILPYVPKRRGEP